MLLSISDNNYKKIEEVLKDKDLKNLFLFDKKHNLKSDISSILNLNKDIKNIFVITDSINPNDFSDGVTVKSWSLRDYMLFFRSKNRIDFGDHKPLYDYDVSRLRQWKMNYALGPLKIINKRLQSIITARLLKSFIFFILTISGILIQIIFIDARRKCGFVEYLVNKSRCLVYFDGSPEKDHYGESYLVNERLDKLEGLIKSIEPVGKTLFLINSGPRHEYIVKILDIMNSCNSGFIVFAKDTYRYASFPFFQRNEKGKYLEGSNINLAGDYIYSEHCLSLGAGIKELWYFNSKDDCNGD